MTVPIERLTQVLSDSYGRGQSMTSTMGDVMLALRHEMLEAIAVPGDAMGLNLQQRTELIDAIESHCLAGRHHTKNP